MKCEKTDISRPLMGDPNTLYFINLDGIDRERHHLYGYTASEKRRFPFPCFWFIKIIVVSSKKDGELEAEVIP